MKDLLIWTLCMLAAILLFKAGWLEGRDAAADANRQPVIRQLVPTTPAWILKSRIPTNSI